MIDGENCEQILSVHSPSDHLDQGSTDQKIWLSQAFVEAVSESVL